MTSNGGYIDRFLKLIGFDFPKEEEFGGRRRLDDEVMEMPKFSRIGSTTDDVVFPRTPQLGKSESVSPFMQRYQSSGFPGKSSTLPTKDDRKSLWADIAPSSSSFAQEQYVRKFTNQPLYLDPNVDIEISDDEDTATYVPRRRKSCFVPFERSSTNGETLKSPTALQKPIPALIPRSSVSGNKMRPIERRSRIADILKRPSQAFTQRSSVFTDFSHKFHTSHMKKPTGISKENRLSRTQKIMNSVLKDSFNLTQKNNYKKLLDDMFARSSGTKQRSLMGPAPKPKIVETINLADLEYSDDEVQITSPKSPTKTSTVLQESINNCRKKTPIVAPLNADKSITLSSSGSTSRVSTPEIQPVNTMLLKVKSTPCCQTEWLSKTNEMQLKRQRKKSEADYFIRKMRDIAISSVPIVLDDSDEEEEFVLPELTPQQLTLVRDVTQRGSPTQVIISKFNLNITRNDLGTLVGDAWLNDEVINFYMNLLTERSTKAANLPKVYAMNTFFAVRLLQAGHGGVKRWTRKVDIFAHDVIPVPVHVSNVHWCMAIIHMKNRTIRYYDSMGQPNMRILDALEQYLKSESLDKKQQPFDMKGWEKECMADAPRQMNGSDCGVFSCMFAEYITRGSEITFTQADMPYFRQKMILEIATGQLLL
uniref:Ubiquitin-like protease family profile domain-containing protein n=2 Tax=Lutzomyia longipalpis TaxID=7200 RepID=A0A1B0CMG9_LUTLO